MSKTRKAALGTLLFIVDFILTGFVTCYLWNTVVSYYFGVITITFWQGWLLSFVINYFIPHKKNDERELVEILSHDIVYTALTWAIVFLLATYVGI